MTEIHERSGGAGSATDQAKERVQQAAGTVQEKAQEARGQARERVRQEVDRRSTEIGEQLGSSAGAMRRAGEELRGEGNETPARLVDGVADRGERLGRYLTEADGERILRDVEAFARKQPWLVTVGGVVLGFFGARFLKASGRGRYDGEVAGALPPASGVDGAAHVDAWAVEPGVQARRGELGGLHE